MGELNAEARMAKRGGSSSGQGTGAKTPLIFAVERGDVAAVRGLAAAGEDVNASVDGGATALMYALWSGDVDVVRCLVGAGADVNAAKANGVTPLIFAVRSGSLEAVRCLLDAGAGASVSSASSDGLTALMAAVGRGDVAIVEHLLLVGAEVNAAMNDGMTALIYAAWDGDVGIVRCLVETGADVNATMNDGMTPLVYAASSGSIGVVRCLVDAGANVNAANADGMTPLMFAAESGGLEVFRYLVHAGAAVNAVKSDGWAALMYAVRRDELDTVRCLVEAGVDVNAASNVGMTALMLAVRSSAVVIVRTLVENGADVNASQIDGWTALMYATKRGELGVMECLVAAGAAVNAAESDGLTALMYAAESGKLPVVQYLVDAGADCDKTTADGRTAIFFAANNEHIAVQRLLMRHTKQAPAMQTGADGNRTLVSTAYSSKSWFISPSEVDLLSVIDSETVGIEYRATWLDAAVVVKLFVPDVSVTTFVDEVALWHQLRHPNVIKLYGACDVGHHFFVQEFASNGSVVKYLAACGRVGPPLAPWKLLHEAALGLAYLHERKIVHGNLRGSNILVGSDGSAKLANFGLSASTSNAVSQSPLFGSSRWQAPERLKGEAASYASDVYSLGLCIVEVITRQVPWARDSESGSTLDKERWNADDILCVWSPGPITDDAQRVISKMCHRDPLRRETASSVARALERLSTQESSRVQAPQSEPEPLLSTDEYMDGELRRLWGEKSRVMSNRNLDGLQQFVSNELDLIYKHLKGSSRPRKVLENFRALLTDFIEAIDASTSLNRILRLSSTRAAASDMSTFRRRLSALRESLDDARSSNDYSREQRWEEQRSKQLELFVSEISRTLFVMNELETEQDRAAFLLFLKSEIDNHSSAYSNEQLSVMRKAYADVYQAIEFDALVTTPPWFIPWYEMVVDMTQSLGSGGFGDVYRARWLDSEVVVKQVKQLSDTVAEVDCSAAVSTYSWRWSYQPGAMTKASGAEQRKELRAMFEREVGVWFGLSHPHVVRLFGACHVGTPFFACEYASNGSLDKYLRKHPDALWQMLHQAALGVQYLHARGIVHGDLKCNNIVVGSDEKAKVTDFGLSANEALQGEDEQGSRQLSGAWQWVAPECLKHGATRLSFASDVYAFGMCIVEALRVVELSLAEMDDAASHVPPLPWGNFENAVVKTYVVRRHELPLRPQHCSDTQWSLVARMCAHDPTKRIKISTVVEKLAKFSIGDERGEQTMDTGGKDAAATAQSMLEIASNIKRRRYKPGPNETRNSTEMLGKIYDLLWDRIELAVPAMTDGLFDPESLQQLIERAQERTASVSKYHGVVTPFFFTEAALRGYALHRSLDKLIDDSDWRIDGTLHNWKTLLGLESDDN